VQTLFNGTLALTDHLVNQKGGLNLTTGMTKKEEEEEENRGRAVIEITRLYDLLDNTSTDRIDRRKVHVKW
jgi:hypothetical protein